MTFLAAKNEAIKLGFRYDADHCTRGDIDTCDVEECSVCAMMDCPGEEPMHYHHDGCPYCYEKNKS